MTRWIEGNISKNKMLQELANIITNAKTDNDWKLYYPYNITDIDDIFVLRKLINNSVVYIEFFNPNYLTNHFYIECRFGTDYTAPEDIHKAGSFKEDCGSLTSRFSWFVSNTSSNIKSWIPIRYWISINSERIVIILKGDSSGSYKDALTSFGYFGSIEASSESIMLTHNFGITVSSDMLPYDYLSQEDLKNYGELTGTGVLDFCMLQTLTGFPFQGYFIKFNTPDEFVNKHYDSPSSYTKGYHFSKIKVGHKYEGQAGKLLGVSVGDHSNIHDCEELVRLNKDTLTDEVYQTFIINCPYSILNNSPNVLYAINILKDDSGTCYKDLPLEIFPTSQTVQATYSATFRAYCGDLEVTNLDEASWIVSVSDYTVKKGTVQTTSLGIDAIVTVSWKGKTASASLHVTHAMLYILPNKILVPVGTDNIVYRCFYGANEVTNSVVWTSNNPVKVIFDGNSVKKISDPITTDIIATWHNNGTDFSAVSKLTVYDVVFVITPSSINIDLYKTASFKATVDGQDVTVDCTWDIDSPYTITKETDSLSVTTAKTCELDKAVTINVHATIAKYGKTASAVITVVDKRTFEIRPDVSTIAIGQTSQFKAYLDGQDVTSSCTWTVGTPYSIGSNTGTISATSSIGSGIVTATHTESGKSDTANLDVNDTRILRITPSNSSIAENASITFSAYLDIMNIANTTLLSTKDVTTECDWSIGTPYVIGLHTGIVTNTVVSGTQTVKALHTGSGKSSQTNLTVTVPSSNVITEHPVSFYFLLNWDMIYRLDLDFSAKLYNGLDTIYYNNKSYEGSSGSVWLDHDNVRDPLKGSSTDLANMEIISIFKLYEVPIQLIVTNFSGGILNTDPRIRMFDATDNLLKTFILPINLISGRHTSINIATITNHLDGTYTLATNSNITVV